MKSRKTEFRSICLSLQDMLGKEYLDAVCRARSFFSDESIQSLRTICVETVDFFPKAFNQKLLSLLPNVGKRCCSALKATPAGATTSQFRAHTKTDLAPLSGMGYYRIGEDGRMFLISKSEHYHVSLGHGFPGYSLIERARRLGIPNATHNNTRGHITRILEEELVRTAAGIAVGDSGSLKRVLSSKGKTVLNRVLNLETGSIAAEAATKLILSRFYKTQDESSPPMYSGKIPVLLVIGDDDGGLKANYHGTTVVTQIMRGMWPELLQGIEKQNLFLIRCVRANDFDGLEEAFTKYTQGDYRIAGCIHELVLMNYGARRLSEAFVRRTYALCKQHDVLTVVDEIQTCIWSPELYMFREYGIKPNAIVIGKGFPGGEYAASRILFCSMLDSLPQFGALVTNGQEELASLAYLVTMKWAETNADVTRSVGDYYEERLNELAARFATIVPSIEGKRQLAGLCFSDLETGKQFVEYLTELGLDISVQTYKKGCPPIALTKLPLIAGYEAVDAVLDRMENALKRI